MVPLPAPEGFRPGIDGVIVEHGDRRGLLLPEVATLFDLDGPGMSAPRTIRTTHHESPLVITDRGGAMAALPGPVVNHTDDELTLLESLVGREPPFAGMPSLNRY